MSHVMNTYNRLPVTFSHGQGVWLFDEQGKRYLDGLAGVAVCGLGHGHPVLVQAISEQAAKLIHTSNIYGVRKQEQLADQLAELSGMEEVFFCNSGAEANEGAIKLARLYAYKKGNAHPHIIVMKQAWHGRTIGTLAATGSEKARQGFGPLPTGFIQATYNDIAAIEQAGDREPQVTAVLLEILQGEGGINIADIAYLRQLRALCDAKGWLLMVDEVQSGIGRTGKWFAHQWADIKVDVMTLAKGLGSGVPIGAVLAQGNAAGVMTPGTHGTTFGGNPLVCAAAIATLKVMADEKLLANAIEVGAYIQALLKTQLRETPGVVEIRGQGLMIGIELNRPCGELMLKGLEAGLLINVTQERVVRLLPPLIITQEQAKQLVDGLTPLIQSFLKDSN